MKSPKFKKANLKDRHGDTIIEVVFALMIFGSIAVGTISIMNSGINKAQRSLELSMVRNTMDSQGNALRYIHDNYIAEIELSEEHKQFSQLWEKIVDLTVDAKDLDANFDLNNLGGCEQAYDREFARSASGLNPFVINPRFLQPQSIAKAEGREDPRLYKALYDTSILPKILLTGKDNYSSDGNGIMRPAPLYPRFTYKYLVIPGTGDMTDAPRGSSGSETNEDRLSENTGNYYREVSTAEGIWIVGAKGGKAESAHLIDPEKPEYYDFYIRTCWNSPGMKAHSNLMTTVRLYNPDVK